jgi:hypothetical protein
MERGTAMPMITPSRTIMTAIMLTKRPITTRTSIGMAMTWRCSRP